jgi:hypothetical protein
LINYWHLSGKWQYQYTFTAVHHLIKHWCQFLSYMYHNLVRSVFLKSVHKNIFSRLTFITCMAISNLRAVSHLKKINDTSKQPTSKCKKKDICLQNQIFHCRSVRCIDIVIYLKGVNNWSKFNQYLMSNYFDVIWLSCDCIEGHKIMWLFILYFVLKGNVLLSCWQTVECIIL